MHDLLTAVRLLTVLPLGKTEGQHAARWFAAVGWLFGGMWVAMAQVLVSVDALDGLEALLGASLMVCASAVLSGMMHWDGLADCADGLGARGDAERRLAVMRDSSVGAFGAGAMSLVAIVQTAALAMVLTKGLWWALWAAPVLARLGAALMSGLRPPARAEGLGARHAGRIGTVDAAVMALAVLPLVWAGGWSWSGKAVTAVVSMLIAWAAPLPLVRRIGGFTGDVAGATIVVTETAVLAVAAFAGGAV